MQTQPLPCTTSCAGANKPASTGSSDRQPAKREERQRKRSLDRGPGGQAEVARASRRRAASQRSCSPNQHVVRRLLRAVQLRPGRRQFRRVHQPHTTAQGEHKCYTCPSWRPRRFSAPTSVRSRVQRGLEKWYDLARLTRLRNRGTRGHILRDPQTPRVWRTRSIHSNGMAFNSILAPPPPPRELHGQIGPRDSPVKIREARRPRHGIGHAQCTLDTRVGRGEPRFGVQSANPANF